MAPPYPTHTQSAEDVLMIRSTLDAVGGQHVRIICKIENQAGLRNIDAIIAVTDGIMVARGDLAMEVWGGVGGWAWPWR